MGKQCGLVEVRDLQVNPPARAGTLAPSKTAFFLSWMSDVSERARNGLERTARPRGTQGLRGPSGLRGPVRQQGAQLLVQLVLVAQLPAAEELHVDPHSGADEPQFLGSSPRR